MKGLKCIASLLLSITSLGLFVNYSDVNAKSYSVDSLLIHSFYNLSDTPLMTVTSTDGFTPKSNSVINATFDPQSGKCKFHHYWESPIVSSTSIDWQGSFYNYQMLLSSDSSFSANSNRYCQSIYAFGQDLLNDGSIVIPEFERDSIPFSQLITVDSFLPYNFMYLVMPFGDSRSIDGTIYEDHFDLSELLQNTVEPNDSDFVYYSDIITGFSLPVNFDSSLESLQSGTTISASFNVNFGEGLSSSELSHLVPFFYLHDSSYNPGSFTCSSSYFEKTLSVLCRSSVLSYDSDIYSFSFGINNPYNTSGNLPFSSVKQSITFSDFIVTLNDDSVYGGLAGYNRYGSFPNVAPGAAGVSSQPDFQSSLSNLFHFSFFNPFAPIFALFSSDSDGCRHIPVIAGMLHAEDDLYCPWFPSSVRTVVTPVIYFSSMMLLFGFAVRWLGSSSGNLFEDSPGNSGLIVTKNRGKK